jgi:hypothetical protein
MNKPLSKNIQNDINVLLNDIMFSHLSLDMLQNQIINVLNDTYNILNKLDQCRIENDHLGKFENDRPGSVQKYINHYQKLFEEATEKEDEDLTFRYRVLTWLYKDFLVNPEKALAALRLLIASNYFYGVDQKHRKLYIAFMSKHDLETLRRTQRNYENQDLFLNLYKRFEGYQITREKIIKSAGLKIFAFFETVSKVQKTKLATQLGYLFSTLGENLNLDPKRAGSLKVIGEFNGFILLDYLSNKKGGLYDFGLEKVFNQTLKDIVLLYKKQGNLTMVGRINNNRKKMEAVLLAKLLT